MKTILRKVNRNTCRSDELFRMEYGLYVNTITKDKCAWLRRKIYFNHQKSANLRRNKR